MSEHREDRQNRILEYLGNMVDPIVGGRVLGVFITDDDYYGLTINKDGKVFRVLCTADPENNGPGHFEVHEDEKDATQRLQYIVKSLWKIARQKNAGKKIGRYLYFARDILSVGESIELLRFLSSTGMPYVSQDFNVIKLGTSESKPSLTLLGYTKLRLEQHPRLAFYLRIGVANGALTSNSRAYLATDNAPILRRKELLWYRPTKKHPMPNKGVTPATWCAWCKVTKAEEAVGLYDNTKIIGTVHGWAAVCKAKGWV